MSAFIDTNVVIRHLTGDPPDFAERATRFLAEAEDLLLTDVIAAEIVYVLESFYEVERPRVAEALRAIVAFDAVSAWIPTFYCERSRSMDSIVSTSPRPTSSPAQSGAVVRSIASFDRSIDRVTTVSRIEPPAAPTGDAST